MLQLFKKNVAFTYVTLDMKLQIGKWPPWPNFRSSEFFQIIQYK